MQNITNRMRLAIYDNTIIYDKAFLLTPEAPLVREGVSAIFWDIYNMFNKDMILP